MASGDGKGASGVGAALATRDLRKLIDRVLRSDADLDAFAIDYFPAVHKRWTGGMDRVRKVNVLFEAVDPAEVQAALRLAEPEGTDALLRSLLTGAEIAGTPPERRSPRPVMARLSGAHYEALASALADAFPTEDALRRMLRFRLERSLDEMTTGNLGERVFSLIQVAEAGGWTRDLIEAAVAQNPGNARLGEIARRLLATPGER